MASHPVSLYSNHGNNSNQHESYPKFLLSEEKIVYLFRWKIVHIIEAINNLKYKVSCRIILIHTVIKKMFHYTTGFTTFGNVRFIVCQPWFPRDRRTNPLFSTQCACCTVYNKPGIAGKITSYPKRFTSCSGNNSVGCPYKAIARITIYKTTWGQI